MNREVPEQKRNAGLDQKPPEQKQSGCMNPASLNVLQIVPMEALHLEQVAEIERRTFSEPWSRNGFAASLRSSDTCYVAAVMAGQVVGYCGFLQSFDEADITNVAVDEPYRGAGVGRRMLENLMSLGRSRGVRRFTLEVRVSNAAAIGLYEKLGFFTVGVRKNFYSKPTEDGAIMWTEDLNIR